MKRKRRAIGHPYSTSSLKNVTYIKIDLKYNNPRKLPVLKVYHSFPNLPMYDTCFHLNNEYVQTDPIWFFKTWMQIAVTSKMGYYKDLEFNKWIGYNVNKDFDDRIAGIMAV